MTVYLDHIDRDGFFFRTAYPFEDKPDRVHICVVPYRFVAFGLLKLFCTLGFWVFFGIAGGAMLVLVAAGVFLWGGRLRYNGHVLKTNPFPLVLGGKRVGRFLFPCYKPTPIGWLPSIDGVVIRPWVFVVAGLSVWLVWASGPSAVRATGQISVTLWGTLTELYGYLELHGVIVVSVILAATVYLGVKKVLRTETGMVFREFAKAKFDKVCPIVPVVNKKQSSN